MVTEVVSIVSEKVTEIEELTETEVPESEGEVDETIGGVLSGTVPVVNPLLIVH